MLGIFGRSCYYSWGGGGGVYFVDDYPDYREDFHGFNNLFFIRAPYHLIRGSILHSSLCYVKHVEHGWLELFGPQGLSRSFRYLSSKRVILEW